MDDRNLEKYQIYLDDDSNKEELQPEIPQKSESKKKSKSKIAIISIAILLLAIFVTVFSFKDKIKSEIKDFLIDKTVITTTTQVPNTVRITFPEGYTIYQIGELLEINGVCSQDEFYNAANTPVDGITIENANDRAFLLEGYIFPDTYEFYLNDSAQNVVNRFIENYKEKITPEMEAKANSLGYTIDEILTLASIIQKECDFDISECQTVSSVFHNRLNASKNGYLGSDVTYFYLKNMADYLGGSDSENFDRLLLNYYTYSPYRKGLPVGAICNPGMKAITAALSPADTDYYYFLTDADGEDFYYAETYEQHLQNGKEAGIMD